MARRTIVLHPIHPERVCWGCDLYCPADALRCGNGTIRTPHPVELFGDNWDDPGSQATDAADADVDRDGAAQ
ncbi:MAG: DUF3079 domain-containing protein [Vicinamibacterales bacterium]